MGDEKPKSAAGQWNIPESGNGKEESSPKDPGTTGSKDKPTGEGKPPETQDPPRGPKDPPESGGVSEESNDPSKRDMLRQRGFWEALSTIECPIQRLASLLDELRKEAAARIAEVDERSRTRIGHLQKEIAEMEKRVREWAEKLEAAGQYRESDDPDLQMLINEKKAQEKDLADLQKQLTDIRKKLGEAKAGIIDRSLDEAERQTQKALGIQKKIYDETYALNCKKHRDEHDYLTRLGKCYQELYDYYQRRYLEVNKHLAALNADGINPITTHVLSTIGSIAFAAAGFFFSTFASSAGFGNQDMLYFILGGLIDTSKPGSLLLKVLVLLGLIVLVTLISYGCYYLLRRLKARSEQDIRNELRFEGQISARSEAMQLHGSMKTNNLYALWLQFIPGIFIAGLILIGVAKSTSKADINSINSSSEGLIVGTSIAMALAGIIYLYIIKVVEPRLLRMLQSGAGTSTPVNWIKANGELVAIIIAFLLFCLCIIFAIPKTNNELNIVPIDSRTRYAILLFIAISLAGAISFAYSVRSHALITISHDLERILDYLNRRIAYCAAPPAPKIHIDIEERDGNIVTHVLKQLSFTASINQVNPAQNEKAKREQNFWKKLTDVIKKNSPPTSPSNDSLQTITGMEPWEERHFSHITDELKAAEFEYREKKQKVQRADDTIIDYKSERKARLRKHQLDIEAGEKTIRECEGKIVEVLEKQSDRRQEIMEKCNEMISEFQDGFHLGMWYRENGMGPTTGFFANCTPSSPVKPVLLINNSDQHGQ